MRVMKDHMLPGDKIIEEPDDFDERYLKIRFQVPRKVAEKVKKKGYKGLQSMQPYRSNNTKDRRDDL